MTEEKFQPMALKYLGQTHQDIRDFFYSILKEHGYSELALKLEPEEKRRAAQEDLRCGRFTHDFEHLQIHPARTRL